jgi:GNAT superfamily N-acetyltransferase
MMTTPTTSEPEAALRLMEAVLREGRPMASEYAQLFGPRATGHIETIEEQGEVISTCAWLRRDLVVGGLQLPVAFVGSVATRADHRGKGHGSAVVERAIARAAEDGAALTLLWADESNWYQERGWVPLGTENVFVINANNAFLLPDPDGVRPMEQRDLAAVHGLYCAHEARVDRRESDTEAMLTTPGLRALVREVDGEVTGYACVGRGEDLAHCVHEWGGSPEDVLPVIASHWTITSAETDRLFVMVPETEADFTAYFTFIRSLGAKGILAMARIGDLRAVAQAFDQLTPGGVTVEVVGDSSLALTGPSGRIQLTGHEILLALCPPRGDRRVTSVVEAEIGVELPMLPIEPYAWGLDSI